MAEERKTPDTASGLEAAQQTRTHLPPPPFITFPFSQIRAPPFWPMQDHAHPHGQFLGIRTPPSNAQFAVPDPHSHGQAAAGMQGPEGRVGNSSVAPRSLALAPQLASRNFPPQHPAADRQLPTETFCSISSLSSQNPAPGLQLFTESPESSLLDPQTSSPPPPQSSRQWVVGDLPRIGLRSQNEQTFSGLEAAAAPTASRQNGGFQAEIIYPPPLASHQAVVADRRLFYETLAKLRAFLALQPGVPKLGGKELDLHTLYCEVTARGGLKQVVKSHGWKDVMAAMKLPQRVSSFFLRKHYTILLHHYEQVYYFKSQGPIVPSPAPLPTPHPLSNSQANHSLKPPLAEDSVPEKRKKKLETFETYGVDPGQSVGQSVTGAIEGKFEHGYLVTVVVGSEKMRGVLYHIPSGSDIPQFAALPELLNKLGPQTPVDSQLGINHRKSKNGDYLKKDPNAPRSSRSGYNFFFAEQRTKMKDYHLEKHTDITKIIGELWRRLTPEERLPYLQRGQRDKERYRSEKTEYLKKSNMLAGLGDENAFRAHTKLLDDCGHVPEQLEPDGDPGFGVANDEDHDYHVSLDADLDAAAFHQSQDQDPQTQTFRGYVPAQLDYSHDQEYQLLEHQSYGQEQNTYGDQQEGYEEDDVEFEEHANDDDVNDDDDDDDDDDDAHDEYDDDDYDGGGNVGGDDENGGNT